jgi:hypothetical protein
MHHQCIRTLKFALGALGGYVGSFGSALYVYNNTRLRYAVQCVSNSNCDYVIKNQSIFYLPRSGSISLDIHKQFPILTMLSYKY